MLQAVSWVQAGAGLRGMMMPEPVRIYDIHGSHARKDDTILPEGSAVHSLLNGPRIAYVFTQGDSLAVAVRGPFTVGKYEGSTDRAYYLRHPPEAPSG